MRHTHFRPALIAAALFAVLIGALTGASEAGHSQNSARIPFQPTGGEGGIAGVVSVEGEVPPPKPITMDADPVCVSENRKDVTLDNLIVKDGRLANALVYVEGSALDGFEFEPPQTAVVLDQSKCRTVPHVLGVRTGQTIQVRNNDRTTHNYTFQTTKNERTNRSMPPFAEGFQIAFAEPEIFITVKDNQHPWERSYIAVMPHPFFAVTDRNGAFSIGGLPPGEYDVVVRHESFKEQRLKVSVGVTESKEVNFTLKYPEDKL
jgi:hypothetical protein